MTWPGFRNYLRDVDHKLYRVAPYTVQFALECLAHESGEANEKAIRQETGRDPGCRAE